MTDFHTMRSLQCFGVFHVNYVGITHEFDFWLFGEEDNRALVAWCQYYAKAQQKSPLSRIRIVIPFVYLSIIYVGKTEKGLFGDGDKISVHVLGTLPEAHHIRQKKRRAFKMGRPKARLRISCRSAAEAASGDRMQFQFEHTRNLVLVERQQIDVL